MRFKEKLAAFMYGRYGTDALSKFMLIMYLAIAVLMLFVKSTVLYFVLQGVSLALCVLIFFRMFSRNIPRRTAENACYLRIKKGIREKIFLQRNKWKYRKTHVYRKCPRCGVQIRLRRVKGDHRCACPKCGESFAVHVK
jgi:hypothetical protein